MISRVAASRNATPGSRARARPAAETRAAERPAPRSRASERPAASIRAPRRRDLMACVSDPSRFQLVGRLALGECCVSDLARRVRLSQSCTTRHLQVLARHGVARGRRQGKRVVFQLCTERATVRALLRWALSNAPAAIETEQPRPAAPAVDTKRSRPPPAASFEAAAAEPATAEPVAAERVAAERVAAEPPADGPEAVDAAQTGLETPRRRPVRQELEDFLL